MSTPEVKCCNKCDTAKPFNEFHKSKQHRDGYSPVCKVCKKAYNKKYYEENKSQIMEQKRKYYSENQEAMLSQKKEYYNSNKDLILKKVKTYRKNNKQKISELKSKYQRENRHKTNRVGADKRARKRNATPSWLTAVHKEEMNNLYWLAQDLRAISGEDYHVDHIVPLAGKDVCGLHVPWNLQVLPSDINISKGNRYDGSIHS